MKTNVTTYILAGEMPLSAWRIQWLKRHGLTDIVLLPGHRYEQIADEFQNGERFGVNIRYSLEEDALGTGGAVIKALQKFPSEYCVILDGNRFFHLDLSWFLRHVTQTAQDQRWYLALKYTNDTRGHGSVELAEDYSILRCRQERPQPGEGYMDGGVYIGASDALTAYPVQKMSLEQDILPELRKAGRLFGIPFGDRFIDMSLPEEASRAGEKIETWLHTPKQRALFLDRDGVVIDDTGYVSDVSQVRMLPECLELVKAANRKGVKVIVVTNQSGIARGYFDEQDVEAIHRDIEAYYQQHGAHVDHFYICPYHEQAVLEAYRRKSLLRKPQPGMLLTAIEEHGLDGTNSMMIGDKDSDVIALPYVHSYLLQGRYPLKHTAYSLSDILKHFHRLYPSRE